MHGADAVAFPKGNAVCELSGATVTVVAERDVTVADMMPALRIYGKEAEDEALEAGAPVVAA